MWMRWIWWRAKLKQPWNVGGPASSVVWGGNEPGSTISGSGYLAPGLPPKLRSCGKELRARGVTRLKVVYSPGPPVMVADESGEGGSAATGGAVRKEGIAGGRRETLSFVPSGGGSDPRRVVRDLIADQGKKGGRVKVSVLGCGRWGAFHASRGSHRAEAVLWGRPGSKHLAGLKEQQKNTYLTFPSRPLSGEFGRSCGTSGCHVISIRIPTASFLGRPAALPLTRAFLLCMKGLGDRHGKLIFRRCFGRRSGRAPEIAVWVGPGHVRDFLAGIPNCMIIASADDALTHRLAKAFASPPDRFYYGADL